MQIRQHDLALPTLIVVGSAWRFLPPFVAVVAAGLAGIVLPVAAGIATGVRLVREGRRTLANTVGVALILAGGGAFMLCASANRADWWDTIPRGRVLGPAGTIGSLAVALFGMGMFYRHSRRHEED